MIKFLAIDDNRDNLTVLKALLADSFPEALIITAMSGREGIEKARLENPSVILLDIVMPEMDGFETCEILKKDELLQRIPVIILTAAKTDAASRIKALKLGAETFLSKPIDAAELSAQVSAMLRIRVSEEKVRQENELLEELVQERTKGLEKSNFASMNLMEDLKVEIEKHRRSQQALKESEARVRAKLDSILQPEGDILGLELADIVDVPAVQAIMDDFYHLSNIGVGILDLRGKILVATGWQDICTKFHRVHPETCANCFESDTELSKDVAPGATIIYRCKNNMWDVVTPITIGGKHMGNLFLGQFLFDDEQPDIELFRNMARKYDFDEDEYLAALEKVPRWSREKVGMIMSFYTKFATIISKLSYGNIKLARMLAEQSILLNERKQASEEIQKLNAGLEKRVLERTAQLELANKELDAFSYSVSHDLCAPLRAINGYTHILNEQYADALDDEAKRLCRNIRSGTTRMRQLIDELLAYARLSRSEIKPAPVNMKELAQAVFDEITEAGSNSRVNISMADLPASQGDKTMIRQVWVNLISNAVKFSSKKENPVVEIGCRVEDEEAVYFVRDNGAGFDMEYANKLYGVFQRLHSGREFEGTGVGLAIVQRVIHRHGGRVWAEGEVGKGATFYFTMPIKKTGFSE